MSDENLPVRQQTDLFSGRAYPLVPLETGRHSIIKLPEKGQELATRDDTTGEGSTKIGNINGQNTIKVENHVHHHAAPVINVLVQSSERSHREEHLPVIVLGGLNQEPERAPVRYSSPPEHHAESWFGQLAFLLIAFMGLLTLYAVISQGLRGSSTSQVVVVPAATAPTQPERDSIDDFENAYSRH